MKFTLAQQTRIGGRNYNQDRVGHAATGEALLMVVADGMGGHYRGEIAAELAVASMAAAFRREALPKLADPETFLFRAIGRAHLAILRNAQEKAMPESPRTVLVACVVQDGHVYWSHIGDSRLYLIRHGRILARTKDHSYVQHLVDIGRIREEAIPVHPERNRVLQCVGGPVTPKLEPAAIARLERDDVVLLCSDGFWGPLTQRQMLNALIGRPVGDAIPELTELAERRAGPHSDNITVIAMGWNEEAVAAAESPHTLPQQDLPTDVRDFTATEPDFMHMSDAEIERAVDEIRDVLRKNRQEKA